MVSTYAHNTCIFIISVETIPTIRFIRPSILRVSLAAYTSRHPPNAVLYFTVGVSGNIYDAQINNTGTGRVYACIPANKSNRTDPWEHALFFYESEV